MPNKLSRFWYEIKRRNVHRLMAIYAGTAYVIFEASTLIFPRWGLPEWTIDLVLYLLILGAIVTFMMGWIYDQTPDGIQKTGPVSGTTTKETPPTSNGWKIASYISLVVIVVLLVLNIIPRLDKNEILDKSIAVLPFISLSDDPEKQYLADGIMEAILIHLSKIEDLRVLARTTSEKYRDTDKTATEICQELGVSFALEGSFRKYGDQARLNVQLIRSGEEDHAWAEQYDREWNEILAVESEVAQAIANELQAVITTKEEQLIEKIATNSITAYELYRRGKEEHWKYWSNDGNSEELEKAEDLYNDALEFDSTYAQAYAGLAQVYLDKYIDYAVFNTHLLDSALILANLALTFDNQLEEAYYVRGRCFMRLFENVKALKDLDKALQINPNYSWAYKARGDYYIQNKGDFIAGINNYLKALSLDHSYFSSLTLESLGEAYRQIGFNDKAENYYNEAMQLNNDSSAYLNYLLTVKWFESDLKTRLEIAEYRHERDTLDIDILDDLIEINGILGNHIDAYNYALKKIEASRYEVQSLRLAYAFWQVGKKEEANYYFDKQIRFSLEAIRLNSRYAIGKWAHYDLAAVYAFLGDKDKAYQYLTEVDKADFYLWWWRDWVKNDPMFYSIREEETFQRLLKNFEAKYQAEHERVRQWLEENDML